MKTEEELRELTAALEEYNKKLAELNRKKEELNKKLSELSEEELEQVTGGHITPKDRDIAM